jgi:quercetin dioxygenase-like cupin family protein
MRLVALLVVATACSSGSGKSDTVEPEPVAIDAATLAEADAGPSIDEIRIAAIQKTINETAPARNMCWELGAADNFRLAGTVVLRMTFVENEPTPEVALVSDDTRDKVLTDCLQAVYRKFHWPMVFEPGQQVELPFGFHHPDEQYTVHFDNVLVSREDRFTSRVLLAEANTGNDGVLLTHVRVGGGRDLDLQLNDETTEILTVLDGSGKVYAGISKKGTKLAPGSVVYVKKTHAFKIVPDDAGIELLVFNTPGRFDGRAPTGKDKGAVRKSKPLVAAIADAKAYEIAGGKASVSIVFDASSAKDGAAYMGAFTGQAGLAVPMHTHPTETEVLYVLEGGGVMTVAGAEYPVIAGHAIQIPPATEHSFTAGDDGIKAVQYYTPSGPEQRFKGTK